MGFVGKRELLVVAQKIAPAEAGQEMADVRAAAFQRFEEVSSGLKTRKLDGFNFMMSRINCPCTRVASASTAPGFGTLTA